jgi:glutathionylspermidine synthase
MQRIAVPPRADWRDKVEALGLVWHTASGAPYWNEAAYYAFTLDEIDRIEAATRALYSLFVQAGDYIVERRLYDRFAIPEWCWPLIDEAWKTEPPALNYGRFDLGFDGQGAPKLFEFNCDTPTSLVEAAVIQWSWKEEMFPNQDQFNSLHERLVAKWRDIAPYLAQGPVHFAHADESTGEDAVTTAYLMDTARAAGLIPERLLVADIGWNGQAFLDLANQEIRTLFKLYPWEWLVNEPFGRNLIENQGRTLWIEPIWKMIWSNKAILPILWDLSPRHENLLWATRDRPASDSYVRKPILAREGANVSLVKDGREIASTDGAYSGAPQVFQGLYDLPAFDGQRPVIGSWVVDGEPAGMGVREDGPITGNLSRFVPHIIHG